uniref:Uncharacterized protein n=1 Tax=Strongyloides papillosus TaxID=174720 RepID=A0A0N5B7K6_STREA
MKLILLIFLLFLSTSEQFKMSQTSMEEDKVSEPRNQDTFLLQKQQEMQSINLLPFRNVFGPKYFYNGTKKPNKMPVYEFSRNTLLNQKQNKKVNHPYLSLIYNKHPIPTTNKKVAICSIVPQM